MGVGSPYCEDYRLNDGQNPKLQSLSSGLAHIWVARDRRTPRGICSATSKIWDCRAAIRMCASTRHVNDRHSTPTHVMWSRYYVCNRPNQVVYPAWSAQ